MPENTLSFLENFFPTIPPLTSFSIGDNQVNCMASSSDDFYHLQWLPDHGWWCRLEWGFSGRLRAALPCKNFALGSGSSRFGASPSQPRVLRVRFLWNATSVLGMSGGMRLASLQLVRDLRSYTWWSFALWPCSLGQVEGLAHQNFIFDKVILCNCGGDALWLMALMSCVAVGWPS